MLFFHRPRSVVVVSWIWQLTTIRGFVVGEGGLSGMDVQARGLLPSSLLYFFSDATTVIALCTAQLGVGAGSGWYQNGGATPC
jgi:hypothetical protein